MYVCEQVRFDLPYTGQAERGCRSTTGQTFGFTLLSEGRQTRNRW